jgi:hypothetical protein
MSLARPLHPAPPATRCPNRLRRDFGKGVLLALCAALAAMAVWYRFCRLGTFPGLNGDEAWMGVQAVEWLRTGPVAWRTPTGNPINVFFFLPQAGLHAAWGPSIELLRLPAALSGTLALVVNLVLCGRVFDRRTAVVSTLLLAVLPVNIAYSRFAWDACQTVLASLLVIYPALEAVVRPERRTRCLAWSGLAFAAALVVHPTNIFLAPMWGVPALALWKDELLGNARALAGGRGRWPAILAVAGTLLVLAWAGRHWLAVVAGRFAAPGDWLAFSRDFLRLLSGATVFQFIAGSIATGTTSLRLHDAAAACAMVAAACGVRRLLQANGGMPDRCLLAGWALTVLGFFLVAGPKAIAPHFERYAICLIAPTALAASRGLSWLIARPGLRGRLATIACLTAAWLVLADFDRHYFQFIERTGGESHRAFRTAATEPKQAALDYIRAASPGGQAIVIVADEWWTYWPLRYLALADSSVHVTDNPGQPLDRASSCGNRAHAVWAVRLIDAPDIPGGPASTDAGVFCDGAGRPTVHAWKVTQ